MAKSAFVQWCKRRTKLEIILLFALVLLVIISLGFLINLFIEVNDNSTCTSKECVRSASSILSYLNETVNPCENFHDFVCKTYIKDAVENKRPSLKTISLEHIKRQLETIISGDPKNTSVHSLKLQRLFFQSCMNTTAIERDENMNFLGLLEELGGWPVIKRTSWNETWDWKSITIKARKVGFQFEGFLDISVTDENILKITYPSFIKQIPQEITESYVQFMNEVASLLGNPSFGPNGELRRTMHFENELAKISEKAYNASLSKGPSHKKITFAELQNKSPRIPWTQLLAGVVQVYNMTDEDFVEFEAADYLKDLEILLYKTSRRIQANYLIWKIIEQNIDFLTKNIREAHVKFLKNEKKRKESRRTFCLMHAHRFKHVAEAEYLRQYVDNDKQFEIKTMFENIKEEFIRRLEQQEFWGRNIEKQIEIAKNMSFVIGGSPQIFNVEKYEEYLGWNKVNFNDSNINVILTLITKASMDQHFKPLKFEHKTFVQDFLWTPQLSVNAYYIKLNNEINAIILPAPMTDAFFFAMNRPHFMNYGALGSILGHEFAHGILSIDVATKEELYKERNVSAINEHIYQNFGDNVSCLVENYDNHVQNTDLTNQLKLTGNQTLEENFADQAGLEIARAIYQTYVDTFGAEPKLPGIKYTPKQLFWIMSSLFMCQKPPNENERHKIDLEHADTVFRINNRLMNSEHFSEDFECPVGSKMNPLEKCKVL